MELNRERLEEGSTENYRSEPNTSPTDELSAASAFPRGAGEWMIYLKHLIREIVREELGLAKQEHLCSMKENPTNQVPKRLKLLFRNKISLPVFTGKRLVGENDTAIEIALVDALTHQIIKTGAESIAKIEIVGFRVDDDDDDDKWTFQDFEEKSLSEKKGKRILQGNTCLQLKEGVCSINKIYFTHNSEYTKNGLYRLGAGVVDAALMKRVQVATTEAFLMKDNRTTYSGKRPHPLLSDKVCRLQHIGHKGSRAKRLKDAGVITVKDFLSLLYKDQKRLQDILKLTASSDIWDGIVTNAQASNGMFLWLNEKKTGVVLDAKLQLQGLIVEPRKYIPVDQLSETQKMENKRLVKIASEDLELLQPFEDETSLKEHVMPSSLSSANQISIDEAASARPTSVTSTSITQTPDNSNKSNFHIVQGTTSQYERGKESILSSDHNHMTYSMNYHLETPNALNSTELAGTSSQALESCGHTNDDFMDWLINSPASMEEFGYFPHEFGVDQTVPVCTTARARTRWINVSKLLRRNSVRERISLTEGIQAFKKQRCC